ncbi:MAG TPA: adenylate/guanylate cyclase domain-containing protein [Stellaceae bacterium]|nr:adenylate/guanylate cyclase domain-containing protein [Stellaceae bacterium]
MKRLAADLLLPLAIAAVAIAIKALGFAPLEAITLGSIDLFQRAAPRAAPETPVLVIDIDEESLRKLGQWPWPRTVLADLTDKLTDAGAAAIGYDLIFPEADRTSPQRLLPTLFRGEMPADVTRVMSELPDNDAVFAAALARGRVVIGSVPGNDAGTDKPARKAGFAFAGDNPLRFVPSYARALASLPQLEAAAPGIGSLDEEPDWDGLVRRMRLVERVAGSAYPTFPAEVLRVAFGAKSYVGRAAGASGEWDLGQTTGLVAIRIGPLTLPTDAAGRLWIGYRPIDPGRWVSVASVLDGTLDLTRFKDRIVLVGSSAAGLNDLRATPVGATVPGVEVHAQAIDQALQGWFLTRPDWTLGAEFSFIAGAALILAVALPRLGAAAAGAFAALALIVAWSGAWWLYRSPHLLLDPAYPSLVILLVYGSSTIQGYLRSERARRQIKQTFSRLMAPALVEQLAAHPERLKLGGENRDMTILFSDIRGFTGIAEGLGPQELTLFINEFLQPMSDVVMTHDGVIDKYIGDCIMAFWNAPLPDPRHAAHAVAAAKEMRRTLAALNGERERRATAAGQAFKPIRIGVGINTGECCVGNMGSHQRMEYTVLGDSVNLASRLEGASKTYGVDLILSESTAQQVPEEPLAELDLIRVKGRDRAVRIFTILDADPAGARTELAAAVERHRQIRAAYLAQEWDRVLALIDDARAQGLFGLGPLYAVYRERIAQFRAEAPEPGWDGVYHAHEK